MNTFKFQITETIIIRHEMLINTELSFAKLIGRINEKAISKCEGIDDCVYVLEKIEGIKVTEITESDPKVNEMEIIDITEV